MRFFVFALAVLVMVIGVLGDLNNKATCATKFGPDYYLVIKEFCAKNNIMLPSTYASVGHVHRSAKVAVRSTCSPPQWLPTYWCETHFWDACANLLSYSVDAPSTRSFGKNNCQNFKIASVKHFDATA